MSIRPFLLITIISALVIAGTAALFSVTGIATLFAGHFLQVAIMAGALEIGKIVVVSVLYRYWPIINVAMKSYMIIAVITLMIITSAGIFGYLSDAYQQTKGKYDITNAEIQSLELKKQFFEQEYSRYEVRLSDLTGNRSGQETRLDSLYSRGATTSARRVEDNIKRQDNEIIALNERLLRVSDSISVINTSMIEKQIENVGGELGPLQYIARAFDTDMDTAVKWFIFLLIFVFDPLAIALVIAANLIFVNRQFERKEWTDIFSRKRKRNVEQQMEDLANKEFEKEEANIFFPEEKSYDAFPADKDAFVLDNTNQSKPMQSEVKSDAIEDNKEEEIQPKKKSIIRRIWKSSNWIEPEE